MNKKMINLDLLIVGGGPAGLTAAIYAARSNLNMLLIEDGIVGGQVKNSYTIENYPGFAEISGDELAQKMYNQAVNLGANIDEFDSIIRFDLSDNNKVVETLSYIYNVKTIIIATGAVPKKLPVENESVFAGKGIHYCAVCDGAMYKDQDIAVVGGGNSALEEALFLSKYAKKVYIIRRHDYFNGEKKLLDLVNKNEKIEILYNKNIVEVNGKDFVDSVILQDTKDNSKSQLDIKAIFTYIGTEPKTTQFKNILKLDDKGYIYSDENMNTNIKGVFAAGDVRKKEYRQITTAVNDGTIAALEAERFLNQKSI